MSSRFWINGLVLLVVVALSANATSAQTTESDLPRLSFPMAPTAYPMESLAANEEGTTVVEILIAEDGSIAEAEIHDPSGFPLLDDAAVLAIRNARLPTPPKLPDGTPTTVRALADVVWELPIAAALEYLPEDLEGGAPIAPGDEVEMPSPAEGGNQIRRGDYPSASVARGEHGRVAVHVLIDETGAIVDTRLAGSSGYDRLDEAAVNLVERFQYNPGSINGVPAAICAVQVIRYTLSNRPSTNCFSAPEITAYQMRKSAESSEALEPYDRWVLVNEEGVVEDSLLLTEGGWMRLAPDIIAAMNENADYDRYSRFRARPPTCWLYEGLDPMMNG